METYFISDLHFGHENILKYDKRPFQTSEENDEIIIQNWNNTIRRNDDVYILGDISWHPNSETYKILKALKGNKHLIIGNHDKKMIKDPGCRTQFVEITPYKELYLDNREALVLCHYPILCFNNHMRNWKHLYGHVHITQEYDYILECKKKLEELQEKPCNMYNVGCMIPGIDYIPRTIEEIINGSQMETF